MVREQSSGEPARENEKLAVTATNDAYDDEVQHVLLILNNPHLQQQLLVNRYYFLSL